MGRTEETLDLLLGTWSVERSIDDRVADCEGSFRGIGRVVVQPHTDRAREWAEYEESGELRYGAYLGPAMRRLRYLRALGGAVAVEFSDGRPFIELDLTSGRSESLHRCGADRYELTTIAHDHDLIEERWKVRGPDTAYDARTWLRRIDVEPERIGHTRSTSWVGQCL